MSSFPQKWTSHIKECFVIFWSKVEFLAKTFATRSENYKNNDKLSIVIDKSDSKTNRQKFTIRLTKKQTKGGGGGGNGKYKCKQIKKY